jgi:hypothetical protein
MLVGATGSLVLDTEDSGSYDDSFNPSRGRYVGMDDPVL